LCGKAVYKAKNITKGFFFVFEQPTLSDYLKFRLGSWGNCCISK